MTQRLLKLLSLFLVICGPSLHAVGALQLSCDDHSGVLIDYSAATIVIQVPSINGTYDIIPIPGLYTIPPLCRQDPTLCRPLIIEGQHLVVPAVGSLVFVNLATPSQKPYVVPITQSCHPTTLIYAIDEEDETSVLWVACMNDSSSSLVYLLFFIGNSGGDINASFFPLREVSLSESSTGDFSESILLPDLCSTTGVYRLYVVHASFIWHFPVTGGVVREFVRSDVQLENCSSVSYIEHSGTSDDVITIHCSSGVVVSYSVCSESAQYHSLASGDGIPYSCGSGSGSVRYKTDSIQVLSASANNSILRQFDHTLGDITYGKCSGDFFAAITASGSLYGIQLDDTAAGQEATKLARVCDDTSCVRPAFGSTGGLLVYDVSDSTLFSVSVVAACVGAVIGTPHSVQRPSYVGISSTGSLTCECTTVVVTPTESPDPPELEEMPDTHTLTAVVVSVVVPLVILVAIITGVVIGVVIFKCRKGRSRPVSLTAIPMAQYNGHALGGGGASATYTCSSHDDGEIIAPASVEGDGGNSTNMVSQNFSLPHNTEFTPEQVSETNAEKQDTDDKINDREVKRRLM